MKKNSNNLEKLNEKVIKFFRKINIMKLLNKNFFTKKQIVPFVVGGLIRDVVLNKKNDKIDIDIVLLLKSYDPECYKKCIKCFCKECQYKIVELDNKNLVYRAVVNTKIYIDFTYTFDLQRDFFRRDYTINSLYFDIYKEKLIDLNGCIDDILNKKLKTVNFDNLIIDPIRMIRGIRIKNEFGLTFDPQTEIFIKNNFFCISGTNPVRMRQEITKIFNLYKSHLAIKDLIEMGFFDIYNIKISNPEELIEIVKVFDLSYFIYSEILKNEYDFVIREKSYYLFLLLSTYIIKNSRDISNWGFNIIFGDNIIKKSKQILFNWNKRQDPKFIINIFKHKNSNQTFEFIFINLLLNIFKVDKDEYVSTLETLFKVCNYICENKESIIPFDKYIQLFNVENYDKYVEYVISTLV
ncbi:MAG: hypothetical protein RMJ36_04095 [Candidatus Calescibacterium sp.]|nr:hypothetical protein [Candidatus Calescibacterium sp.]MDW8132818.1 hypothetical protein [Candidatus Calescibacterium sp.]